MATRAQSDLLQTEDKVKTLRRLIFHEMWKSWRDKDIKCQEYKDEVKHRFSYLVASRYGLLWSKDKRELSNHLSSVFTRLNKSIRAAQKRYRLAISADETECLEEIRREKRLHEMRALMLSANHHICPIDGYPELTFSGDYAQKPD